MKRDARLGPGARGHALSAQARSLRLRTAAAAPGRPTWNPALPLPLHGLVAASLSEHGLLPTSGLGGQEAVSEQEEHVPGSQSRP